MDKYHHVIEQYKNGNFTMESWNLPFQISRSCEVGITDNVNIVIGADFLAPQRIWLPTASCELIIALLTEREHLAKTHEIRNSTQVSLQMRQM